MATAAWLAFILFAGGGLWYGHVLVFPWKTCPRCGGRGRIKSGGVHRDCGRCASEGRVRRWGAPRGER